MYYWLRHKISSSSRHAEFLNDQTEREVWPKPRSGRWMFLPSAQWWMTSSSPSFLVVTWKNSHGEKNRYQDLCVFSLVTLDVFCKVLEGNVSPCGSEGCLCLLSVYSPVLSIYWEVFQSCREVFQVLGACHDECLGVVIGTHRPLS